MIKMLNLVSANVFVDMFYADINERIPHTCIANMVTNEIDYSLVRQLICDVINDHIGDTGYSGIDAFAACDKVMSIDHAWDAFGSKLATPVRNVIYDTFHDVFRVIDDMCDMDYAPAVSYDF